MALADDLRSLVALVTDGDVVGTIEFDCFVREKHTLSAQATEHAIEGSGQARTDHVLQKPDMLVLEVVASDTPLRTPKTQANGTHETKEYASASYSVGILPASPYTPALGPLDKIQALQRTITERVTTTGFAPRFNRRRDVWAELRRLKEAGEIISVSTSLQVYPDMVIEEVDTECTVSNGRSLEATITLKRIALVDSALVDAPEIPGQETPRGNQPTVEASDADAEAASLAYKVAHKAGALPASGG